MHINKSIFNVQYISIVLLYISFSYTEELTNNLTTEKNIAVSDTTLANEYVVQGDTLFKTAKYDSSTALRTPVEKGLYFRSVRRGEK